MDKDDYYLNLSPPSRHFGMSISKMVKDLGLKKAVIISDGKNDAFCTPFIEGLGKDLDKDDSITVQHVIFHEQREGILRETAGRAMARQPECVVLCTSSLDGAILSQHLRKHDQGIRILSSAWAMSDELLRTGGSAIEGMAIFSAVIQGDNSRQYKDFEESYREKFAKKPTMVSVLNYDALKILARSMEESPGFSPEEVKSTLTLTEEFEGLQQGISFDKEGDAARDLVLHVVNSGKFVPEGPENSRFTK
jgi:branched-chain amino acid transport system substrate-binding protein